MGKAIICILLFVNTATAAERIKRIAILTFENGSPDDKLDWVGIWLGETIHQEFKRVPTLSLVDRPVPKLDKLLPPILAGNLMIVKSGNGYRALRLSAGIDAWTVPAKTSSASELANDRVMVVFEHDNRFFAVDIATGKTITDMAIPQSTRSASG